MVDDHRRAASPVHRRRGARTGLTGDPLPFFDARARPNPLATLVQRSTLSGARRSVPSKISVAATARPQGDRPSAATTTRVAADPEWAVHRWDTRHDVLHDGPDRLLGPLRSV